MSLNSETPFTMPVVPAGSTSGNGGGGMGWGNDGSWWIIILFLFIFAGGWNRGNWGGNGNGATPSGSGAIDNYVLASDFAQVERKLDTVQQGLCDGFYTTAQQINGLNTAVLTNGNATQMAIMQGNNALQAQIADCCCTNRYYALQNANATQAMIQANTTQGVMNTTAIQNQIQNCCCDIEKSTMQTRFEAQQMNCNTLQAIDRVGDRIIDYLAADKAQALRDENQALRLAASQQAQNNYLVNQLRPCPVPAYQVPNPYAGCGCYSSCGCGC